MIRFGCGPPQASAMHAAVAGGAARCFSRLARPSADRTKLLAAAHPPLARRTLQHLVAQVRGSHSTCTGVFTRWEQPSDPQYACTACRQVVRGSLLPLQVSEAAAAAAAAAATWLWVGLAAAAAEGLGSGTVEGAETENWHRGGGLVHRLARVDASAVVEVGAVIHAHALVGPNVRIGSGCVVGSGVTIGPSTVLGFNVSLQNCSIGDSCILHNGVCVGQDGFGFFVNEEGEVVKKPQLLRVRIGNHVEIGANSCVDRGSWRDTVIGEYTKIDNLVQVGHNVEIGRCCMLCGQVGVGGSATIGDYVVLGGQAGVADHRTIVSNVRVAAKSGVTTSINEPGDYGGFPAIKAAEFRRALVAFKRLGRPASSKPDC